MNDRLSARRRMYGQVTGVCGKYRNVWQGNVAFAKAVDKLGECETGIDQINKQLQGDSTGSTEKKEAEKLAMAKQVVKVAGALTAYAEDADLLELVADADISKDDVMKAKEVDADDIALFVYDLAVEHLAALADYGITQADLEALQKSIDNFTGRIGKPRLGQNDRKSLRAQQKALFAQADKAIQKTMENLIHQYEEKDKVFYDAFQSARSVIRDGGGNKTLQETKQAKAEMV